MAISRERFMAEVDPSRRNDTAWQEYLASQGPVAPQRTLEEETATNEMYRKYFETQVNPATANRPTVFNTGNTQTNQGVPVESRGTQWMDFQTPEAGSGFNQGGGRRPQDINVVDTEPPMAPSNGVPPVVTPPTGPGGGLPTGGNTGGPTGPSWGNGGYAPTDMSQLSSFTPAMLQFLLGQKGLDLKKDELEKLGLGELGLKDKVAGWQKEIQDKTLNQNQSQFGSTLDQKKFEYLRDKQLQEQALNAQTGLGATGQMQQEEQAKIASAVQAAQSGDNTQLQRLGLSQNAAQAIMAGKSDAERINIANQQMSQAGLLGKSQIELDRAKLGLSSAGQADASKLARQKTALDASGMLANSAMDRAKLMASLGGPENAFRQMQALRGLDRSGNLQLSAILRGEAPAAAFQAPQAGSRAQSMDTIADQLSQNGSGDARAKSPFGTMAEIAQGNASGNSADNSRLSTEGGNFLADQTGDTGRQVGDQAGQFGAKNYQADTGAMTGIQDYAGGLGREENFNQQFAGQIKDTIGNSATNDMLTGIAAPNTAAGTFGNMSTMVDRENLGQQISTAAMGVLNSPEYKNEQDPTVKAALLSRVYQNIIPGMTQAQSEQLNNQIHNLSAANGGGPPDVGAMNNFIKSSLGNQALKGTRTGMGAGTRVTDAMNTYDQRNPRPQLAPENLAIETHQDFLNRQGGFAEQVANYENQRNQVSQNLWRNEGLTPEQAGQANEAGKNAFRNSVTGSPMNPAQIGGVVNDATSGRPIRQGTFGGYPDRPPQGSFASEGGTPPMWNGAVQAPQGRTLGAAPQPRPYQATASSSVGGWGQEALNTPKPQPAMAAAPRPGGANPGNPNFTGVKPNPNAQSWEDKQATTFQSGLPAANQLNARNFGRLNNSEKQFTLAGYEAAGQSKDDVMDTIQKTLPKATGPKFGRVA